MNLQIEKTHTYIFSFYFKNIFLIIVRKTIFCATIMSVAKLVSYVMEKMTVGITVMRKAVAQVKPVGRAFFYTLCQAIPRIIVSQLMSQLKITILGSCPMNHFRCGNKRCVPNSRLCNGKDNCGDNTDEIEGCTSM